MSKQRLFYLFMIGFLFCYTTCIGQSTSATRLILDADTGNEVDDYYALARALSEPSWDIICLNATQWEASHWAVPKTMENSHRLNQVIVAEMDKNVKTIRGGVNRMFDWGDQAQHSAAAYEIIKQAKNQSPNDKLTIVALGALTNIASAIYIDPSVSENIKLYWLGTTYDFEQGILKRQDFNCMMDQQALEVVLMSDAELHIMPVNIAVEMEFAYQETKNRMPQNSNLSRLLLDRWYEHLDGGREKRILWDLALIQAIVFPEWCKKTTILTSKDNGSREIHYFSSIDVIKMKDEFFEKMKSH
ncbi:MAG: nucleoside hydrolase [Bacteroidota bacterium]